MWSANVNLDGVLPSSLCITHDALWWLSASGVLYTWRTSQGDGEPTHPVAVAQLDRRVECMVVSSDASLIAVVSSTFMALLEIEHTSSPTFLRMSDADAFGEASVDEVVITAEERRRAACTIGDVRGVLFNSDASLAAVCTDSALLLWSNVFGDASNDDEDGTGSHLASFDCTHLGASTKGCSVICFSGARQLLVVDDVNHLVLLQCVSEDLSDVSEDAHMPVACQPNASPMAVNLQLMVDGHICGRTARVTSVACSHSGVYGESLVVLGFSNGTVQLLNGRQLQALRTWNVRDAITAAFIDSSDEAAAASSRRRSGLSQVATRDRRGIPYAAASTAAPQEVTIFDVCVGAHLITVCTSHGVVYYSRFTFQLESAYTQLLTTPLVQAGAAAAAAGTSVLGGVAMRGGSNGRWAYTNVFDGVLYFSWRDVDTHHTLEARSAERNAASNDIVHARAPLPAAWLDNVATARLAQRPFLSSDARRRQPAKGSGYTDAPWSVQQERKRKARAAAARDRKAQAFGAISASAAASTNELRFQYDFDSIFGVGRATLTRMEASSSALRGLHTRAVVATAFATAGDALITAGADGRIRQLHFPIARAKGADGVAGRILAGHAAAVTAIDANLSRQHPLILSAGAEGCLRLWSPGARDTPIAECTVGCSGGKVARPAPGKTIVSAQFFYLDKLLLSCAADALELRRNAGGVCSSRATAAPSSTSESDRVLSEAPLYRFSVGSGHTITSATAVNHFVSNLIFLATSEKEVQVLDVAANTVLWREGTTHTRGIYRVATGRTSRYAAAGVDSGAAHLFMSASLDSTAALWDVRIAKPVQLFTQHSNTGVPSLALEVAPGIGVVAVGSQDNAVYMYDLRGGCGGVALDVLRGFDSYGVLGRLFALLRWLNDYPARVQFRRTTQRFLSVMNTTESYTTFVEAAASLDHYCGVAKWAQDAPPLDRCNAVGLLVDATAAQHLIQTNNLYAMETFLCSLLKRNAHGLMDASIYRYYNSAPHCLEDYTDSIECLITAYAAGAWHGESAVSDSSGAAADRALPPTSAAPVLRDLRPCWVRLEASAGAEVRPPLLAGTPPPVWSATHSGPSAALPAVDVTAKIQQVWQAQFRKTVSAIQAPWATATAAPSRQQSTSASVHCLGSSAASAAMPLTDTSTATVPTCASTLAGEKSILLTRDDAAPVSHTFAKPKTSDDTKPAWDFASVSPPLSPLLRTEDTTSGNATALLSFGAHMSVAPPLSANPMAAAPPSPEVALARQLRSSCASLCRFLDGCALPSALPQQHHAHQQRCSVYKPAVITVGHRLKVLRKVLHSYGRTALVLSGGSSMGTYHAGVARALHEAGVLPDILCGSSAGSIIAAMICTKSPDELHAFMQSHVLSTEAMHMSPFGEDSDLPGKLKRFFKTGFLMDVRSLMGCMRGQCGDMTFLEAYQLSGKVLNVSVTRSQQEGMPSDRHVLLNYVTAPDVVIWSAVSASCALPGLFTAVQLIEKPSLGGGTFAPYLPGELWCDGSIAQDIPRRLLIQLFGVNYLIVSQVNPYVIPFLRPPKSHHIIATSGSWLARLWFAWVDVCGWVLTVLFSVHLLPRFGRFEMLFMLFAQFYSGDLTIQPIDSVMKAVPDYMNLVNNPSADYISYVASRAQSRTWPLVTRIRLATRIERCLQREIRALEAMELREQTT
ncbi:Patatin-like phospholipase family protein [Leishmania donovani]|uniref:Patatin-like phospholipase family protein n=1 Tax=Leishmania donovani TaxID=5661 RepID=A0A504X5X6_LEIDO|nr:Patatin-like phospholipase family protein [Leishmania donovani]